MTVFHVHRYHWHGAHMAPGSRLKLLECRCGKTKVFMRSYWYSEYAGEGAR